VFDFVELSLPKTLPRTLPKAIVTLAIALVSCRGKVVGTATLTGPGSADVDFQSTGKPLVLWADTDGEWTGMSQSKFPAHYEIDVVSSGSPVGHIACDTKDSSEAVCSGTVTINQSHRGHCELKMKCDLPAIPAGPASLHVTATSGASKIKNMSLNVREK